MFYVHTSRMEEQVCRMQEEVKLLHKIKELIEQAKQISSGTEQRVLQQIEAKLDNMTSTVDGISIAFQNLCENVSAYESQTSDELQELNHYIDQIFEL